VTSARFDLTVIGAGIVGLATAHELLQRRPGLRIAIVDKEDAIAFHQSGRNSGVVHAGLYYTPGSLRSRLCREGRDLLIRFAEENEIPYRLTGKLVVAVNDAELPKLHALHERGTANGLQGLRLRRRGGGARDRAVRRRAPRRCTSGERDHRTTARSAAPSPIGSRQPEAHCASATPCSGSTPRPPE